MKGFVCSLCLVSAAAAQTSYVSTNGTNLDWRTPTNWSPAGVPGAQPGDSVTIAAGSVTLNGPLAAGLRRLELLDGGVLTLGGAAWSLAVDDVLVRPNGILRFDDDESDAGISLAVRTLTVDFQGLIDANGTGFPGGTGAVASDGAGPGGSGPAMFVASGASHGGFGGLYAGSSVRPPYGDLIHPSQPGSGGGSQLQSPGGNGGGRIRVIASQQVTVNGRVRAEGVGVVSSGGGSGSGGSIWISTPALGGAGSISVRGGWTVNTVGGGGGRLAIDGPPQLPTGLSLEAHAGPASGSQVDVLRAGAGTIVFVRPNGELDLIVDGRSDGAVGLTPLPRLTYATVTLADGAMVRPAGEELIATEWIHLTGLVRMPLADPVVGGGRLTVRAPRIQFKGLWTGVGSGLPCFTPGSPGHGFQAAMDAGEGGGSHGGRGSGTPAPPYGSLTAPYTLGSPGGASLVRVGHAGRNGGCARRRLPWARACRGRSRGDAPERWLHRAGFPASSIARGASAAVSVHASTGGGISSLRRRR